MTEINMKPEQANHTPTPWIVDKQSFGDVKIVSPCNKENWCCTGIFCHTAYNGSGSKFGPSVLVTKEEAEANAAFIVKACNEHGALCAVAEAAKELLGVGRFKNVSIQADTLASKLSAELATLNAI